MKIKILIITFLGLIISCYNDNDWFPKGNVDILSINKSNYEDNINKSYGIVTLRISNSGLSIISKSTFTIEIKTDENTYWKSSVNELRILPGESITTITEFDIINNTEIVDKENIVITSSFFE